MAEKARRQAQRPWSRRPRVRHNVTAAIGRDICGGRFPPGTVLPRESDLCETYGVSRTVIRESLKVLETKGLVRGRPRVGTLVCDRADWNVLDAQILEWMGPDVLSAELLRSILEARRTVEPAAAFLAAARATAQDIADLERACDEMGEAEGDLETFTAADARFTRPCSGQATTRSFTSSPPSSMPRFPMRCMPPTGRRRSATRRWMCTASSWMRCGFATVRGPSRARAIFSTSPRATCRR